MWSGGEGEGEGVSKPESGAALGEDGTDICIFIGMPAKFSISWADEGGVNLGILYLPSLHPTKKPFLQLPDG